MPHSPKSKADISETIGGSVIYVYDRDNRLEGELISLRAAAEFLGCCHQNVAKMIKSSGRTRKGF